MYGKIESICFITDGYPSEDRTVNAFVENLVNQLADSGIECTVIAPQSITNALKYKVKLLPYKRKRITKKGNIVNIYTPKYISVSSRRFAGFNLARITLRQFRHVAEKTFRRIIKQRCFDAIYGHFIFPSGITANYLGQKFDIPSFLAFGENGTYSIDYLGKNETRKLLNGISGIISVSSLNKKILIENEIARAAIIEVFPNGVDETSFYAKDKTAMRIKLGLDLQKFIIVFVGRFEEVKGPLRVCNAISQIDDDDIGVIFIGEGAQAPNCNNILFSGPVQHEMLSDYLNAADIFVLPTMAEGCCNAIIEALACGLPIVSSNMEFNYDILDDDCAILIDPNNIEQIMDAIKRLKVDDCLRNILVQKALAKTKSLSIVDRAERIILFMEECIEKGEDNG